VFLYVARNDGGGVRFHKRRQFGRFQHHDQRYLGREDQGRHFVAAGERKPTVGAALTVDWTTTVPGQAGVGCVAVTRVTAAT